MKRRNTLQLIGIGLFLVIISLVSAAVLANENIIAIDSEPPVVRSAIDDLVQGRPNPDPVIDDFRWDVPNGGAVPLHCDGGNPDGSSSVCWCDASEGGYNECVSDLQATCHEGDHFDQGPNSSACWYGEEETGRSN